MYEREIEEAVEAVLALQPETLQTKRFFQRLSQRMDIAPYLEDTDPWHSAYNQGRKDEREELGISCERKIDRIRDLCYDIESELGI